jgi:hypothetical protein
MFGSKENTELQIKWIKNWRPLLQKANKVFKYLKQYRDAKKKTLGKLCTPFGRKYSQTAGTLTTMVSLKI